MRRARARGGALGGPYARRTGHLPLQRELECSSAPQSVAFRGHVVQGQELVLERRAEICGHARRRDDARGVSRFIDIDADRSRAAITCAQVVERRLIGDQWLLETRTPTARRNPAIGANRDDWRGRRRCWCGNRGRLGDCERRRRYGSQGRDGFARARRRIDDRPVGCGRGNRYGDSPARSTRGGVGDSDVRFVWMSGMARVASSVGRACVADVAVGTRCAAGFDGRTFVRGDSIEKRPTTAYRTFSFARIPPAPTPPVSGDVDDRAKNGVPSACRAIEANNAPNNVLR